MGPINKKRKIEQPTEITFDLNARQDYLSGYHRRKQARIQHAREVAVKKEKEEKARDRREMREKRKEELESHVKAVNDELKKQNRMIDGDGEGDEDGSDGDEDGDSDKVFEGFTDEPKPELPEDDEFVDEDKYTTVTVEAMGSDASGSEDEQAPAKKEVETPKDTTGRNGKRVWTKNKPTDSEGKPRPKKRNIKFRYESKAERAATRQKQKAKNAKAASARRNRT